MKTTRLFAAILVVSLSAATTFAQSSAKSQAVSGTNPRPQTVSSPLGSLGDWFSSVLSAFGV